MPYLHDSVFIGYRQRIVLLNTLSPDTLLLDIVLPDIVLPDGLLPDIVLPDGLLPDIVLPFTVYCIYQLFYTPPPQYPWRRSCVQRAVASVTRGTRYHRLVGR